MCSDTNYKPNSCRMENNLPAIDNLLGMKFGRLTIVGRDFENEGRTRVICDCECGVRKSYVLSNLKRGTTKSCGCLQRELLSQRTATHRGWANNDPLYNVWHGIRKRCDCPTCHNYSGYGGRGIKYAEEWNDFANFRSWALSSGYEKGLSIDRIDVNGDYTPENCRWATNYEQQNNKRNNRLMTYRGETHTAKEWSRILGINYQTLYANAKRHDFDLDATLKSIRSYSE